MSHKHLLLGPQAAWGEGLGQRSQGGDVSKGKDVEGERGAEREQLVPVTTTQT